jgi:hypothetical protein
MYIYILSLYNPISHFFPLLLPPKSPSFTTIHYNVKTVTLLLLLLYLDLDFTYEPKHAMFVGVFELALSLST